MSDWKTRNSNNSNTVKTSSWKGDVKAPILSTDFEFHNYKPSSAPTPSIDSNIPKPVEDHGFWSKVRNLNLEDTPIFKAITSPINKLYEIPFTQRLITTAGETVAGPGAYKNEDGSDMRPMDTGSKLGNITADVVGTGLGFGTKVPGLNESFQGTANNAIQPLESSIKNITTKAVSKLPLNPKLASKAADYGSNALKNGLEFAALNTDQGLAQNQSIDDSLKSGANGLWQGALFGTAIKGLGDVTQSAFPKWKTTYEANGLINNPQGLNFKQNGKIIPTQSIYDTLHPKNDTLSNFMPGEKVTFNGNNYILGDKSFDGQFNLLDKNGKVVLSTNLDNLKPSEQLNIPQQEAATTLPNNSNSALNKLLENSDNWKDKSGILGPLKLQRETWDRNIVDIAGNKDGEQLKKILFDPIHDNEANRIRFMNEERAKIKALNLTQKESEAVQKFGEGKYYEQQGKDIFTGKPITTEYSYTIDNLKHDFPDSWQKIIKATNVFKDFYKRVLPMANETLIRNGYKPVGNIDNYFPHFSKDNPILKALGVNLDVKDLPTDINGLTHQFKPGKNWVGNFLHRTGNMTDFGAVEGFDRYIEGVSKVIHHTDDIQRLRNFSRALRLKYSPDEISNEFNRIMNSDMDQELKDSAIQELLGRSSTHLSNAVADLDEFTNVLAGKKDLADRADERKLGRPIYNISNTIMNRIAKNMVALNPGSWLTNFIPLTQALATTGKKEFLQGMEDTLKSLVKKDDFVNRSTFLTNREGSDILSKGITDKIGDTLSAPMRWIDNFTSQVITRSKYLEGINKGLSKEEALKQADSWASKIIGDRSLGSQPTLFNQKSPTTKLLTQFQLEVNNQISFMLKDLPKEYLKNGKSIKNITKLSSAAGQMALFGFLYNELYSKLTGRRPAIDPIGAALGFKNDLNNPNLNNSDAVSNLTTNAIQQLPFVGGIIGGGRLPISSALPDFNKMGQAIAKGSTGEMNSIDAAKEVGKSLSNTGLYLLPPLGGGQIKKTVQAINALKDNGVYNDSKTQLKYPINTDTTNIIKSLLFGPSSLKETNDYYNNKRLPLSEKQTTEFQKKVNNGSDPNAVYQNFMNDRAVTKEKNNINNLINGLSKTDKSNIQSKVNAIINNKYTSYDDKIKKLELIKQNIKRK